MTLQRVDADGRRAVASVRRELRNLRHDASDRGVLIYAMALIVVPYGIAVVLGMRAILADADWLGSPRSLLAAAAALTLILSFVAKAWGPFSLSTADIATLFASGIDRAAIYTRRILGLAVAAATVGAVLVIGIGLDPVGTPNAAEISALALQGVATGLGALVSWMVLHGLALVDRTARFAGGAGLLLIVATIGLLADPGSMISALSALVIPAALSLAWPPLLPVAPALASGMVVLVLAAAVVACARGIPRLIDVTRLRRLASRSEYARAGYLTMDAAAISDAISTEATWFRRMWLRTRGRGDAIVERDALGMLRTLPATLGAIITVIVAAIIVGGISTPGWWAAAAAALTLAAHTLTAGFRSHIAAWGSAGSFDPPVRLMAARHLLAPGVVMAACSVAGGVGASASGALGIVCIMLLALSLQGVAADDGGVPASLQGPIETPAGDLSLLLALAWMVRAPLTAATVAWMLASIPPNSRAVLAAVSVVGAGVWSWWAVRRGRGRV